MSELGRMQDVSVAVRSIGMHDVLRYARESSPIETIIDGFLNYFFITATPGQSYPKLMLERGITANAETVAIDGPRRAVIAIRSSPWKAGHETNPWHDEFDLDHGHVRYYGDHKPGVLGIPGVTLGNRLLLEAFNLYSGSSRLQRLAAPPLLLFRSQTVHVQGRAVVKGHVEFCGVALIERLEYIVQRDPKTGSSFPNIVLDLAVMDLAPAGDLLDMRWIDDRRDASLSAQDTLRFAPVSWKRWVDEGRSAISRVRRRVMSSRVKGRAEQTPSPNTPDAALLREIYDFFDGRKHSFELLAARVAARALGDQGGVYHQGWLSRAGGDGGLDFVARLDVGSAASNTPLVVLGQAKCVTPGSSISPDEVARVVARLRRGWIGVFVTTGVFSRQAQVEVIDDEYPIVLIPAAELVDHVRRIAAADFDGDVRALLLNVANDYAESVTYRRPEEVLTL
jgi:hypothetical protein